MDSKEEFEFLNSELWLKYTQDRYAPLEDIKYRLETLNIPRSDWANLKKTIQSFRKLGSIPLFINSIDKKFWFFPSDSINKKIHEVESLGNRLYDKIDNQKAFKREFLRNAAVEEAITSAIYEGANTTRSKAKELVASGNEPKNKDEWMLINNFMAMEWIKDNSTLPVTRELFLRIHEIVARNTLEGDDANFCGKFRNDTVHVGTHQGIAHEKISETLDEVIELAVNHPRFIHGLIKGILLHYFTAYVHPFFDGNGRTARTLFYFKAMKNDLKFVELLSISASLKMHGKRYEKSFELVKKHELDVTYFIDFCLDSLLEALGKVEEKVDYLLDISRLIEEKGINLTQVTLLQRLALNKHRAITIEKYAESIEKSREVARKELKHLVKLGFLREVKVSKKFVYFVESKRLKEEVELAIMYS